MLMVLAQVGLMLGEKMMDKETSSIKLFNIQTLKPVIF